MPPRRIHAGRHGDDGGTRRDIIRRRTFHCFCSDQWGFCKGSDSLELTNFTARDQLNFDKYKWSIISYEVRKGARCGKLIEKTRTLTPNLYQTWYMDDPQITLIYSFQFVRLLDQLKAPHQVPLDIVKALMTDTELLKQVGISRSFLKPHSS